MLVNRLAKQIEEATLSADALERLSELSDARAVIDSMIEVDVRECRRTLTRGSVEGPEGKAQETQRGPITWETIGAALRLKRQTAWRRFRHVDNT
jgi:hypothetical protein